MEETTNSMAVTDADLDAAWGDDDYTIEEADQPTEGPEEPEVQEQPEEPATEPVEQPTDQPEELYTLTHMGEQKQVNRTEMTALAQKGMDYDRIRTKYDELKAYKQQADPAYALVKAYAEQSGMDVATYLDHCREQELIRSGLNEQNAKQTVKLEKQQAELDARKAEADAAEAERTSALAKEKSAREAREKDMAQFIKDHPDFKGEDIPQEVWAKVREGMSLTTAYTAWENAKLRAELAAVRQNNKNKQTSTGSLRNPQREEDDIDRIWNEDD